MFVLHSKVNKVPAGFLLLLAGLAPAPAHAEADPTVEAQSSAVTPPELSHFVEAELGPQEAPRDNAVTVRLELTVQADGSTADVVVVSGVSQELDTAALAAVRAFQFTPARRAGEPLAVRIQYDYVFEPSAPPPVTAPAEPAPAQPAPPAQAAQVTAAGALSGKLLESGTRKPVIGATVSLPELGLSALTDGEGAFSFEHVPQGEVHIVIEDLEHERVDDHESVVADQLTTVSYHVEQTGFGDDDLVAVGRKAKKEVTRHALSVREVETVPGTNGDALKAIQNLPGVARTTGDQLILRGGGDTKVFVNGLPLPAAFHFFGLRSTVGNGLLESVEVTPGNYSARYGRANGGVVDIGLRRPADDGLHGFGQVDLFDASAMIEGPVGKKGSFALAARRSYIDTILPLVLDEKGKKMFPTAPRYYDFQAAYDLKDKDYRFRAYVLGSSDAMALLFDEPAESDPAVRGDIGYSSEWISPQILFEHQLGERTHHSAAFSYLTGPFSQSIGRDMKIDFTPHLFELRDEWSHQTSEWLTLRGGIDIDVEHYQFDVVLPEPVKEGQIQSPLSTQPLLRASGSVTDTNPAAWVGADVEAGPVLLAPSLRVDHYSAPDRLKGTLVVQPRFDTRWAVSKRTTLKGGVGFYSEGAEIDETHPVFGNPKAGPDLSVHYSAGVEQHFTDAVSLDVTGFYKQLYHMLAPVDDPTVKLDNKGKGRAYGAEVLLRHDSRSRFYGWLAYTLMRSERLDPGARDYRLFDTDQTHNLTAVGQYRLTPTWEVGARFRFVSGNPTTPVVGATYDSDADTYVPVYGAHNSERLAAFHQLDVRVDKHFVFDDWRLTAYLDVQNVYNHSSAEGVSYNYDYSQSRPAAGLPLIPSFGVKGEF